MDLPADSDVMNDVLFCGAEQPEEPIAEWTLDELDHDFGAAGAPWIRIHDSDA